MRNKLFKKLVLGIAILALIMPLGFNNNLPNISARKRTYITRNYKKRTKRTIYCYQGMPKVLLSNKRNGTRTWYGTDKSNKDINHKYFNAVGYNFAPTKDSADMFTKWYRKGHKKAKGGAGSGDWWTPYYRRVGKNYYIYSGIGMAGNNYHYMKKNGSYGKKMPKRLSINSKIIKENSLEPTFIIHIVNHHHIIINTKYASDGNFYSKK